ncbi:MAG: hypothetical protein ABSB70_01200 [Candidatus Velthaea sp.]|jgi:NNP family nitrate/nitrite transporter-like MFS transporter
MLRPIGGLIADRVGGVPVLRVVFIAFAALAFGIALAPPLAIGQILVFAAVGCLGAGNGAVFQIVPQRFGKEIGIITGIVGAAGGIGGFYLSNLLGISRAASGTFASGFITFAALALLGAVLITLRGRVWSGTFLIGRPATFTFAIEEG